ncbi:hypothetical protein M9H77_06946 [Catharanthus roseus]|uniref:Uncharacterized protein n=1 Tax=Catharanthus roseus TaxID=4058 RepID=A0ACC0BTM7_CATRO|nr:hypothetical protein M9H77_06946 [Catharanthus roseus]
MEIGNFSSHAKTFDNIPYNYYGGYEGANDTYNYCENSPYGYYKGYHDSYDDGDQSCDRTHLLVVQDLFHAALVFIAHDVEPWNICDSLRHANHCTFGLLEDNSYGFDGSLFSLLGDHCVKFQGEIVEHLQYVLSSLDPYVMDSIEHNLVEKPLLLVNGLIIKSFQKSLNFPLWIYL